MFPLTLRCVTGQSMQLPTHLAIASVSFFNVFSCRCAVPLASLRFAGRTWMFSVQAVAETVNTV